MDYCSTCRRHLNGALVCPGCGAYAPDIAPPFLTGRVGPDRSAEPTATGASTVTPAGTHGGDRIDWEGEPQQEPDTGPATGPSADTACVSPARPGRAARRRQLARLKKHQRRAMVATAFALVGGGLSLATLDRHTTSQAQAATAPDDRSMGAVKERVETEPTQPAPQAPEHRAPHTAPDRHAPISATPQHQTLRAAPSTAPRVTRLNAVPSPRPTVTSAPQQRTTTTSSSGDTASTNGPAQGRTDTATPPAPAPTTGGMEPDTSGTTPAPAATSPAQLCLLGLCLG
ncbi:SCO2400 family protein [Streptomyces naphthomycinicus]|uniref:SCO2400 family protein n=1 Tax=Streptomyces naphthomycinicus TaxID=2872625 RepID=UPI003B75CDA1